MKLNLITMLCFYSVAACLSGCSTGPVNVSDRQILSAKSQHIPVIIYGTSFNNPDSAQGDNRLSVQFLVTADQPVSTLTLFVRECSLNGPEERGPVVALNLKGPFQANTAYISYPTVLYGNGVMLDANRSWHLIIKGVQVVEADGSSYVYARDVGKKDISKVLTPKIANYCATNLYNTGPIVPVPHAP